nr:Rho termination factor N-terminal domain-containing protein [Odoribacter sp. OF09-27XD]
MYDILELNDKLLTELRQIAKDLNIKRIEAYKKQELIYKILDQQAVAAAEIRPVVAEINPGQPEDDRRKERKPEYVLCVPVQKKSVTPKEVSKNLQNGKTINGKINRLKRISGTIAAGKRTGKRK